MTEMYSPVGVKYANYISDYGRADWTAGGGWWLDYTGFMLVIITPVITTQVKVPHRFLPVGCLSS